jgi:vacuolar protein sorting-associated protein 45
VFLRPTKENLDALKDELRDPKYGGGYYVYFSHAVRKEDVRDLAFADQHEVVRDVGEMFADFLAVSPHLFSLNVVGCLRSFDWRPEALARSVQGLTSVLLALKRNPVIRFQGNSPRAQRLAERVQDVINKEAALFDFR